VDNPNDNLLRSIHRQAMAQTALQAGAVAELEAQRRLLEEQRMMAQTESILRDGDALLLQFWRQDVADLEARVRLTEATGDIPAKRPHAISCVLHQRRLASVPSQAPLAERIFAQQLVERVATIEKRLVTEDREFAATFQDSWIDGQFTKRWPNLENLGKTVEVLINGIARLYTERGVGFDFGDEAEFIDGPAGALVVDLRSAMIALRIAASEFNEHLRSSSDIVQVMLPHENPEMGASLAKFSDRAICELDGKVTELLNERDKAFGKSRRRHRRTVIFIVMVVAGLIILACWNL
jgi:hypothetical protein